MSQLSVIRDRIKTISNLNKVTRAMEMVTRTRIRRVRQNSLNARNYQELYAGVFTAAARRELECPAEKAQKNTPLKYYLAFFAHKGFCGGYNDKLLTSLRAALRADQDQPRLYLLGRQQAKWRQVLKQDFQHIEAAEKTYQAETADLLTELQARILTDGETEVFFVYNQLVSVLEQKPLVQKIYPLALPPAVHPAEILLEPEYALLYPDLLRGYLAACLERVYWEATAGEYYARLLSMKNANDNAELILTRLNLEYNKTRQTRITQELSEVISTFDILKVLEAKKTREGVLYGGRQ
ncbi:MAG: F0F1 ATP synthase subunit gamma [Candidatus Margulisbacteria bacterium]|jgi:F-type H+-transporting ATPase subunit gamma|nr:F0F1 ATP synthase subunit gamma [Candidatus Margulisiibacteriota bacterium]